MLCMCVCKAFKIAVILKHSVSLSCFSNIFILAEYLSLSLA